MPPADIPSIRSSGTAVSAISIGEGPTPASAASTLGLGTNTQGALGNLTQNAVGQTFQAQVLAQLEDGSFVVQIAENALRMALPAGSTVGETLDMTLLATAPRPAFLLEQQGDNTSASLSNAAKLINTVLQAAQQTDTPATLVGKAPLVASPTTPPPELADALQDSIEFSGVFYESHVSQWVNGDRPLTDLLLEPQAQEAAAADATNNAANSAGTLLPRPPLASADLSKLAEAARNASTNAPTDAPASASPNAPPGSPAALNSANTRSLLTQALNALTNPANQQPKEADVLVRNPTLTQGNAQTINLQLNALEQHRIAWQGEIWPGQQMEWEIAEEDQGGQGNSRGESGDGGGNQAAWQSVVRFDLPHLGKVSATVHLRGGHVRVQVNTASADSAVALRAHGDDLASALEAAGSPLGAFLVKHDEQA